MSEIWPLLLIVGYIGTLIFSSIKQKTQLREEIKFFGWYLVIGRSEEHTSKLQSQ